MLRKLSLTFLLLVFPAISPAQPTGSEPMMIRRQVDELKKQIKAADEQVLAAPGDIEKLSKRRDLYIKLFDALYNSYLGGFYFEKPIELTKASIATMVIADHSAVIQKYPTAKNYKLRGDYLTIRYLALRSKLNWSREIRSLVAHDWIPPARMRDPDKDRILIEQVLPNSDFDSAVRDYQTALALEKTESAITLLHSNLARLYGSRAHFFLSTARNAKAALSGSNSVGYSVFRDLDKIVDHSAYLGVVRHPAGWSYDALLAALFDRANILVSFGRDEAALESMDMAEKRLHKPVHYADFFCKFHKLRSDINYRLGKFDRALSDANKVIDSDKSSDGCTAIFESRGNAYMALDQYSEAIKDFSAQIDIYTKGKIWWEVRPIYRKRGRAYIKTRQFQKGIDDISWGVRSFEYLTEELHRMRAEAYRELGDKTSSLEDLRKADYLLKRSEERKTRIVSTRAIFGRIVMPNGSAVDPQRSEVILLYEDGTKERWSPSVSENGVFSFSRMKDQRFRLFGYHDAEEKGVTRRHFVRSGLIDFEGELYGPIILELATSVIRLPGRGN